MKTKGQEILSSLTKEIISHEDKLPETSRKKISSLLTELSNDYQKITEDAAQLSAQLETSKKRLDKYSNIFKLNPSVMTITTLKEGKYLEINQTFTKVTGYTREEIIGKTVYDIQIWKDEEFRSAFVNQVKNEGHVTGMEGRFVRKDGSIGYTRISAELVEFEGIPCMVATFEDLTEKELAKEKFQSLFHLSPDALIIHRFGHDILEANEAAFSLFGYSREELIGKNMFDLQRKVSREQLKVLIERLKSHGHLKVENEMITRSNKIIPAIIHLKIIDYEGEKAVLAQIHDISTRLKAERETRESEELLRTLINATPDIVCFKDGKGRWMEANKADLELFGLENIDYRGKTDLELSEYTLPEYRQAFESCMISDEKTWEKQQIHNTDEIIPDRNGNKHIYDVIKVPLFHQNGERKGMVVLGRDITARNKAEVQLRESEEKSSSILAALPDLIFEFNAKGTFVNAIAHQPEDLVLPKEEFLGKNIRDVMGNDYAELTLEKIQKTLQTNTIQIYQYELSLNGNKRYYEARMVPKGKEHTLAVVRDVTGQKESNETIARHKNQLEAQNKEYEKINQKLQSTIEALQQAKSKAEESNRLKSAFLATMSHELRTPLNSIIGFSEFLKDNLLTEEVEEYGSIIHRSGQHLLGLVEEVFDLSLIESGQARAQMEYFYLKDMLNETRTIARDYRAKIGKKNIELVYDFKEDSIPHTIYSDAVKIKQVLINLIKNALKFTEEGRVILNCHSETREEKKGIVFIVKDTGIGIPKYKQEDIFEIFQQVDNSDTRKYGGSGIGLSVAKKITSLLDGTIELESQLGIGTTLSMWIPAEQTGDKKLIAKKKFSALPDWSDKTIFIAEDDHDSAELLKHILQGTKAQLLFADNGKEVVDKHHTADLILMDLQMPVMGGLDATRTIKKGHSLMPVIAITARAMKGDRDEAIKAGCDDYLTKPFKKKELLSILKKYL